jgi:hypothetical protein
VLFPLLKLFHVFMPRGATMARALNLTLPIKQDADTLAKLKKLKEDFATEIQPKIDEALRKSKIVHSARVLVVHDKYLMVITEYDGQPEAYTEFFRRALPDVFARLFEVAEGAPPFGALDKEKFFGVAQALDLPMLGQSTDGNKGCLFSAYRDREVKDILPKIGAVGQAAE